MQDKINYLKNMILMMLCDGRISSREKQFLAHSAKALGVESDIVNELFKEVIVSNKDLYEISNRSRAIDTLKSLVVMANVDKNIDQREMEYLILFAKSLGISNRQWKEIINQVDLKKLFDSFKSEDSLDFNALRDLRFLVIKDDFELVDNFTGIAAENQIQTTIVGFDEFLSIKPSVEDIVFYHASEDKLQTLEKTKKLLQVSPDRSVAILTRYQGNQVRYLLEEGIKKCIIEPVYTQDIVKLIADYKS